MRVVVDTNVFASSFLSPGGSPRKDIDLWKTGEVILCLCPEIIEEYIIVLSRLGLEGSPELAELMGLFKQKPNILFTTITGDLRAVPDDPGDDKFVECALRSNAGYIISGDRHLLGIQSFRDIEIVRPAAFLRKGRESG